MPRVGIEFNLYRYSRDLEENVEYIFPGLTKWGL